MNLRYFTDRPVLSIVISVAILLIGGLSIVSLPVEQYPDIAPPTIQVSTNYPGANAETVQKAVIVPLEEAINGVENMNYITSTSSNSGEAFINVFFKQGTDPDMAAVNVQNRVSTATSLLPTEVTKIGVTTMKQQNAELKTFALYCPDGLYDMKFLNNYMKINVEPRLKRIAGVGQVTVFGSNYSMRIWLKPDKMAQYKLIPDDISAVLAKQNIEAATGSFGENHENTFQYTMKYRGRFSTPEEFGNIVIRSLPEGDVLRLREVAEIQLGDEAYNYSTKVNGHESSIAMVYQTAGSNASEVINEIDDTLEEISADLPKGMEFITLNDTNRFLYASIREVVISLVEAILLVVLVVYVFLQDIRSTLIPTISIIVSIVGTFIFMVVAGFSINLLTLFALVLAIGTVVDNAIVAVEAVQARFEVGYRSSYMATNDAMKGISPAILTSTLIFMAVFIPVSMMGGTSGAFYTQFGLTMAVAVGLSAINTFTLAPALCALMLRPYIDENGMEKNNFSMRFRKAFNAVFDVMVKRYIHGVLLFIRRRWLMWGTLVAGMALLVFLVQHTKTGLVPDEDTGSVMLSSTTHPGTSLHQNNAIVERFADSLMQIKGVEYTATISGYSFSGAGPSMSLGILALKDWSERPEKDESAQSIVKTINKMSFDNPELQNFVMTPPMIPGYGMGNGFEMYLQDKSGGDINEFKRQCDLFMDALEKRPEIGMAFTSFRTDYPQYWVDIDAAKCEQAGISPSEILSTISGYYGGNYVSNFNRFSKLYRVMVQADPDYRVTPESLNHIYVRVGTEMTPVSQFVKLSKTYGPQNLSRFNLYNSILISGSPADGYSTGDALQAIKETAETVLPSNMGFEFGSISREESKTTNNIAIIFVICMVLTYLILSGLYESFFIPFAVILAVPVGLLGSFLFAQLFGLENNVYMQAGVIMLIGLLAKTAILLTEYATKRREAGMSLVQAAYSAAKVRLRPILMTALTMVFGLLPLMFSNGVGANGSRSLATGAIGGMLVGTLALLFLVPALFIVFQRLHEKFNPVQSSESDADWSIQAELEIIEKDNKK